MFNATWDLVELPPGKKALSSKWVLKAKPMMNPAHLRLKARLVICRIEQQPGIDYGKPFAPMVKWTKLHTVIALVVSLGWDLHHMDVITAFLDEKFDELIFMC